MTVSYIFNTIDRSAITPRVTDNNFKHANYPIQEIIVTDNGSNEQKIKDWGKSVADKYIENKRNVGNPL